MTTATCQCGTTDGVRLYAGGYRCPACQGEDPGVARYCAPHRCYCGGQCGATYIPTPGAQTIIDDRHKASSTGRRVSTAEYREVQAREAERRARRLPPTH